MVYCMVCLIVNGSIYFSIEFLHNFIQVCSVCSLLKEFYSFLIPIWLLLNSRASQLGKLSSSDSSRYTLGRNDAHIFWKLILKLMCMIVLQVVDMAAVVEIISILERTPITKEALEVSGVKNNNSCRVIYQVVAFFRNWERNFYLMTRTLHVDIAYVC